MRRIIAFGCPRCRGALAMDWHGDYRCLLCARPVDLVADGRFDVRNPLQVAQVVLALRARQRIRVSYTYRPGDDYATAREIVGVLGDYRWTPDLLTLLEQSFMAVVGCPLRGLGTCYREDLDEMERQERDRAGLRRAFMGHTFSQVAPVVWNRGAVEKALTD